MPKTTVKVDKELVREAHELGLNVSKICENALKEAIRRLKAEDPKIEDKGRSRGQDLNLRHSGFCVPSRLVRFAKANLYSISP
jgi:post-segregation antitoxin (ccd killing protein)